MALGLLLLTFVGPVGRAQSTGIEIYVPGGGDLQGALDGAMSGDTIVLQAGATYRGSFILRARPNTDFITIRTSDLSSLPPGVRVGPGNASSMPKLMAWGDGAAIATEPGAHHYRLVGLELLPPPGVYSYGLLLLGGTETVVPDVPAFIEIDRLYIHGDPIAGGKRGIALNGRNNVIKNSYISDIKSTSQDSQAILGWNGPGPYDIINNYLEASGENIMFGGATPAILDSVPSDIRILNNYFYKQPAWNPADPAFAGTSWVVKNLLELKNARRVTLRGNVLENNWVAAQAGWAILLTVRNENGAMPWAVVEDVEITENVVRHSARGLEILGQDDNGLGGQVSRVKISNNLWDDINNWLFLVCNGAQAVTIDHNTAFQRSTALYATATPSPNLTFTNNLMRYNEYGVIGDGAGPGLSTLTTYFPSYLFVKNVLIAPPGPVASQYPEGNYFPQTLDEVGFVDFAHGDYHLSSSSPYRGAGTDGKDLGADMDAIALAINLSMGPSAPPPPPKPVIVLFAAQPSNIQLGQSSTLSWDVTDADEISIDQGIGTVQAGGTKQVSPTITTMYTISVKGPGGSASRTATVAVTVPAQPPPEKPLITVSPASVTLAGTESMAFTATVAGLADRTVVWSLSPAGMGTITQQGVYTAPRSFPENTKVAVTCTSAADPATRGTANVTLKKRNGKK